MKPTFSGGRNIAMKVPPHHFEATVHFYRNVLRLPQIEKFAPDIVFEFGANQLWIDRVPGMSQTELWLQLDTADREAAASYLAEHHTARGDEIEPLPEGFRGFWIASPGDIIHLVQEQQVDRGDTP